VAAVTVPEPVIAPEKATVLFAGVVSKLVPVMNIVVAFAPMAAVLAVTVGGRRRAVVVGSLVPTTL